MDTKNGIILKLFIFGLSILLPVFCWEDYETVLEDWVWEQPGMDNYETCRKSVNTLSWDEPIRMSDGADKTNWYSKEGMNDIMAFRNLNTGLVRSSVIHKAKLWENGEVPYSVPYGLSVPEKKILACAFLYFHENTCIRFVPNHYTRPYKDYISFRKANSGCFSEDMGKSGGAHTVNLHYPYCWTQGTIIHELMHALGFFHEQSRNDRDQYITVHWKNIPDTGWRYQFKTGAETGVGQMLLGTYDYGSIMHYPRVSYAFGGKPTMSAKQGDIDNNNKLMGNREKPSTMDTWKINALYRCFEFVESTEKPPKIYTSSPNGVKPTTVEIEITGEQGSYLFDSIHSNYFREYILVNKIR